MVYGLFQSVVHPIQIDESNESHLHISQGDNIKAEGKDVDDAKLEGIDTKEKQRRSIDTKEPDEPCERTDSIPRDQRKSSAANSGSKSRVSSTGKLVFADEVGGVLAVVTYSDRTHYSKNGPPAAMAVSIHTCCIIS